MPLNLSGLQADLVALFTEPPATEAECIQAWTNAARAYTSTIFPVVSGPVQNAAKLPFAAALAGMSLPGAAVAKLSAAFTAYTGALLLGMPPGSPPALAPATPLSVSLTAVLGVPYTEHTAAAAVVAATIDAWFRTGIAAAGAGPWA